MSDNEQILSKISELEAILKGFGPSTVCASHKEMAQQVATMATLLPAKLESLGDKFQYVAAEMNRRTEVLFKKIDEHERRISEHDRCLIGMENKIDRMAGGQWDKRVRLLEDWRVKFAAVAATVVFLFQTGVSIWSLVKK